jgi:hypothetical protein
VDLERLGRWAPVKERFGPTLPQLLAPRVDRLPAIARRLALALIAIVVVVIVALVLRNRNPVFSSAGPPAFTTSYTRALTREPTPPGAIVLLDKHDADGLVASFEITPLRLPRYSGQISGLLPVIASNEIRAIAARLGTAHNYHYWSQGRTRIINTPAYTFTYSELVNGVTYYGRIVWITPHLTGDRVGLRISMLTRYSVLKKENGVSITSPDTVGTVGLLFDPFERLRFR